LRTGLGPALFTIGGDRSNCWRRKFSVLPYFAQNVGNNSPDYPQQFAEDIFGRIESELRWRDSGSRTGRLYIVCESDPETDAKPRRLRNRPVLHFFGQPAGLLADSALGQGLERFVPV
jgi:hypothetical protein